MLRTLIVDDEAPARARLRRLRQPVEAGGRVRVVGEAADGVEALELLDETPVDLLLLDIQMPELSGFDVLDRLGPDTAAGARPLVVFTTAFDAYALKAPGGGWPVLEAGDNDITLTGATGTLTFRPAFA